MAVSRDAPRERRRMNLSDDVFARIWQALGLAGRPRSGGGGDADAASATTTTGHSRRRAERFPVSARVDFEAQGAIGTRRTATLADVSESGAGLFDARPVGAGETIVLHLPFGGEQTVPIAGKVQYAKLARDGRFRIGVRFITWAEADLEARHMAFASRSHADADETPDKTPGGNRTTAGGRDRRQPRVPTKGAAVVHSTEPDADSPPLHAEMADLSTDGVGFVCPSPLEVGHNVLLRFRGDDGRVQERHCKVVHCRPIDRGFRIGATSARAARGFFARLFG
jgi:PilZ domain-containing protein